MRLEIFGAEEKGSRVVAQGTPEEVAKCEDSVTGRVLAGVIGQGWDGFRKNLWRAAGVAVILRQRERLRDGIGRYASTGTEKMANLCKPIAQAVFVAILGFLSTPVSAVDTTWTFDGDGNWNEAAKWSSGEPIDETFNVIIDDDDSAVTVTLNQSRTIGSLSLGLDDALRIEANSSPGTNGLTSASGFTNNGTISLTATNIFASALSVTSGTLVNGSSGLIHFQAGGSEFGQRLFRGKLSNQGTVKFDQLTVFDQPGTEFEQAGGITQVNKEIRFFDDSSIHLTGGTLKMNESIRDANFIHDGGTLEYTSGSIRGGTYTYLSGTIDGSPTLTDVTLVIGPDATGMVSFQIPVYNNLHVSEDQLHKDLSLALQATPFSSGIITSPTGFTNNGTISFAGASAQVAILEISSGKLINSETGILHFLPGSHNHNGIFGEVENLGTMLADANAQLSSPYSNHGMVRIATLAHVEIEGIGSYHQLAGSTVVNGSLYSFSSPMELSGGTLKGIGTLELDVTNSSATVAPGESVGTLTIKNNDYAQQSDGTLAIELAASDEFDVLAITGTATLDGTLAVSLLEDFIPEAGQAFQILAATGGIEGGFSSILLPTLAEDLFWGVLYSPNAVTLAVSNTGDYNHDGIVNAADFVLWRDTDGAPAGYTTWQSQFGLEAGTGMGDSLQSSVPEPSAWVLILCAAAAATQISRRSLA